jgi:hypothetical protein
MARDIATIKQTNLWGKPADSGLGLEPQRTDLFIVDFTTAQKGIAAAANQQLSQVLPQFIRAVTMPELKTKADVIRRDSVPYQMPSWDEPLDPVKVTFVLDTNNEDDKSAVIQFLDAWLALTRAGRGDRFQGYTNTNWLTLDQNYRVNYAYNFHLFLLRGTAFSAGNTVNNGVNNSEIDAYLASANAMFRNVKKRQGLVQTGDNIPTADTSTQQLLALLAQQSPQQATADAVSQDMIIHSIYVLYNAWLGGYKLSDFSYVDNAITTVDATFYVEAISLEKRPTITGMAAGG